jgi:hypothetical protein
MCIEEGEEVKEKRCKPKVYVIHSKNNSRLFPKSQERDIHSSTGSLQNTKQTCPK